VCGECLFDPHACGGKCLGVYTASRIAAVMRRKAAHIGEVIRDRGGRTSGPVSFPKETVRLQGAKAVLEVFAEEIERWETPESEYAHELACEAEKAGA
jgi:hypothetical protein